MAFTFGAIASVFVILAVAGVFGATAYSVRLRLREVGIRRALGATDGSIATLITRSTARRAFAASVIGLSLGIIAVDQIANDGNLLTNQPGTVALTVLAMLLVVLAGALGPVLRGIRVSPMEVLRDE
jgi:putative ABC transport system permease protein